MARFPENHAHLFANTLMIFCSVHTRWRATTVVAAVVLTALAPGGQAQGVSGTVTDSSTGEPVGRGFVVLLDGEGREVARALSGGDGAFVLSAPDAGVYRLRSERIGYRVWESEPLVLGIGSRPRFNLRVAAIPTRLATVEIVGETHCGDPRTDAQTGVLWEEARKALAAASWGAHQGGYQSLLHRYRRVRKDPRRVVDQQEQWVRAGQAAQPFAAVDPQRLAEDGYVIRQGGNRTYYGPDANVLLHDSFQRTHCFEAVRGTANHEGLVGLRFRPEPDHRTPDISGTLWINQSTSELQHIEFRYANLETEFPDPRIGGTVEFQQLATGEWIVDRWELRTPAVGTLLITDTRGRTREESRLVGIGEIGGNVIELRNLEGDLAYQSPHMVYVSGRVYDSTYGGPLVNQRVWVRGTGYATRTDVEGRFSLKTLLSGSYRITTSRVDSLGYLLGEKRRVFTAGDTLNVDIVIPGRDRLHRYLCPGGGIPENRRALVGVVRDVETDTSIPDIAVTASWRPIGAPAEDRYEMGGVRIRTDHLGNYVACDLPMERAIRLEVPLTTHTMAAIDVIFEGNQITIARDGLAVSMGLSDRLWKVDLNVALKPPK